MKMNKLVLGMLCLLIVGSIGDLKAYESAEDLEYALSGACSRAQTDSTTAECIRFARTQNLSEDTVRTCFIFTHSDSAALACIKAMGPNPLGFDVVNACRSAYTDSSFLGCLEYSQQANHSAATIRECMIAVHTDSARLECLKP